MTLVLTDMKMVSCMFQLPRVRPRQEPTTATSGTMMEGGMQLLNRDGHSISHNSKRHYHDSFVSMNRMRQRGLLCDIVLHVSNKEIKAHKVVLASCSPYFHAMFTSKLSPRYIPLPASCFSVAQSLMTQQLMCAVNTTSSFQHHRFLPLFLTGAQVVRWGLWVSDFLPILVSVQCVSRLSVVWLDFLSSDPVFNEAILIESAHLPWSSKQQNHSSPADTVQFLLINRRWNIWLSM